jgi:ABC-type amino acid transport system permease subunit
LLALALSKTTVKAVILLWLSGSILLVFGALVTQTPSGEAFVVRPSLQGLRFEGGLTLSVELVAMIVGIVLYGSAYVAEVVRGGLNDVPKGLTEAGQALGLSGFHIWSRIKLPMALRMIIPPLGNQWIFIMKATTIGVAIGFSDLFMLVSTSITQSGQTLELIAILMLAFLLVNFTLAQAVNWLNARLQLKAH